MLHTSPSANEVLFFVSERTRKSAQVPPLLQVVTARPSKTTTVGFIKSISSLISDARDTGCIFEKKRFYFNFLLAALEKRELREVREYQEGKDPSPFAEAGLGARASYGISWR